MEHIPRGLPPLTVPRWLPPGAALSDMLVVAVTITLVRAVVLYGFQDFCPFAASYVPLAVDDDGWLPHSCT